MDEFKIEQLDEQASHYLKELSRGNNLFFDEEAYSFLKQSLSGFIVM